MTTFFDWLVRQGRRNDPIGDLANDFRHDPPPIRIVTPEQFRDWVRCRHIYVASECVQAIDEAAAEWRGRKRRGLSLALRFAIFRRDAYQCQVCGATAQDGARLEVDHKHPHAHGGGDDVENLWTLCFECNRGKRDTAL